MTVRIPISLTIDNLPKSGTCPISFGVPLQKGQYPDSKSVGMH